VTQETGIKAFRKARTQVEGWSDIHPKSSALGWNGASSSSAPLFKIEDVAPVVGLQPIFIKKVLGAKGLLSFADIGRLVMLDDASETFVPAVESWIILKKLLQELKLRPFLHRSPQ
jgi:hypothetical protein